jgi:hypothetical protein
VRAEHAIEQRAQMRVLHGGDQLAQVLLHRVGRERRPVDEVVERERLRRGLAQGPQRELRAPARMDFVAPADVHRAPGAAELADLLDAVPDHRGELARAIAEGELQELPAVALGAHLDAAEEENLIQLLAVGEVAYEHVGNRRAARGRHYVDT